MPTDTSPRTPTGRASLAERVRVPDTALAREAAELVRDTTSELIYHHSCRVFSFEPFRGSAAT
ncbi:metal-dependent phosphohydrolase [Streptomyces badius]